MRKKIQESAIKTKYPFLGKGNLKRLLGFIKYHLLDVWPYYFEQKAIPRRREKLKQEIQILPTVPKTEVRNLEVHMLCGHRDADMGVWSSWSLMRHIADQATLVVHSDGSLTESDERMWRKVIPQMEVIPRQVADERVHELLSEKAPNVVKWRSNYKTSPQLIDTHLFGSSRSIIVMDSDVIVFRKPEELMKYASSEENRFSWCVDGRDSYSADPRIIREITGIGLPERFNCGFLLAPRLTIEDYVELDRLIGLLSKDGRIDINRFWACQTYYALIASERGGLNALPSNYTTCFGRTPKHCTARHYVGAPSVRYRYFKEGLPALLRQLD